uniref:Uncharacterized protein n=1 Tax=Rhizophora mucronata TaxID=61149 RepID=A0A2P2IXU3_RHIMU
MKKVRQNCE